MGGITDRAPRTKITDLHLKHQENKEYQEQTRIYFFFGVFVPNSMTSF
jgi:hypothetical protein